ncbi:2-phospho-L-lactate guanylyltransferase [Methanonatronarchaeum thermophilum]|uniref:2-phospho-L-lactate guanylyltransferase n=1 Tax=Methanonatronarchaeum thermophilum TaxID=1927129 RepID=UPI001EFFDC33|nr:2-phospho-L-lactate guanylyltransferase [Methanonatronarchaeum thermophilum]
MFLIKVLVPVCLENPKTGLSSVLGLHERRELTLWMLRRVVDVASEVGDVCVVSPDELGVGGVDYIVSEEELNLALEGAIDRVGLPVLILPSDIPLVSPSDLGRLVGCGEDVVVAPGDRGGTNGLLLRKRIKLQYNGGSCRKHRCSALERGYSLKTIWIDSVFRDIDEPCDLNYLSRFVIKNDLELNGLLEKIQSVDLRCNG